ncbi:MAG TPA: alpha/beta fold hydrolase [Gemmataceae bacterium]|nr:alpha/beta fold hydrolase [Gemmataceae bacterium]
MSPSLALLALTLAPAFAPEPPKLEERARALVTALEKEDFAAAAKDFDEAMNKALPPDKLGETWKGIVKQVGALKKQGAATAEKVQKYDVLWVACEFEKATLFTRVVFDAEGHVTGLSFRADGPAKEYKAPAYVKRDAFKESEVKVGEGEWVLPGTLTLPVGDGPFPGVVLVHGSGPQDRDEAIGGNRPFRDLAWGLASQGVAVLRYEKRTREYGAKLAKVKDLTVKEEVLDDALAAAALLRKTKGIDPKRVFIAGHSLGAMAAPRLGELDPELAGLIVMASPSRPMADVLIEQFDYVLSIDPSPAQKSAVEKLKAQAERLKDPKLSPDTPTDELPFGVSAKYWLSMDDLRPAERARKVKQPLLVLQGGRDYQSTMNDFDGWKKALSGHKGATLKAYPKLNHLFAEGEGKAKPAEYQKEGHVAKEVVDDIAAWVRGH